MHQSMPLSGIDALVVRCPNWVGDVVMATPAFECLRRGLPDAHITALIRPYARGVIEPSPWFDRIVDCDDGSLAGMRRIRAGLAVPRPQAGIMFTNSPRSWLSLRMAGVRRVYGYRRDLHGWLLHGGPRPAAGPRPMQDYYLDLCRHLGLEPPPRPKPSLYTDAALDAAGDELLRGYGIAAGDTVIGLNPGARFGSSKCWPAEYYARLAELLQDSFSCRLLLLTGPGEEDIARSILQRSRATLIDTSQRLASLAELKPLIRRCNLLITNDTGPRHFAVAFDVPAIVLMGSTNPVYTASNLERTEVLRRDDVPCSPCHQKTCPLGHHDCMRKITPETVLAAAKRALPG